MAKSAKPAPLRQLLDLCDELRSLRKRIQDPGLKADTAQRLRKRSKGMLERLADELRSFRFRGSLRELFQGLSPEHFLILATLLRQYLRDEEPALEGRELLAEIFDTSYGMLSGFAMLQSDSALFASGLVIAEAGDLEAETGEELELLERRFRLSELAVSAFLEELGLKPAGSRRRVEAYPGARRYLVDLKVLVNLYQARSARLFREDRWKRFRSSDGDRVVRALDRSIARFGKGIELRLARTENALDFAPIQFAREHGLSLEELLVVSHLVFTELLEGNPYLDAVKLLQLVSGSEEDYFGKRQIFHSSAALRRRKIVEIEPMLEGRELTGEVRLSNWVLEKFLGKAGSESPIGPDEKLDFHLYLENLESSRFLTDL